MTSNDHQTEAAGDVTRTSGATSGATSGGRAHRLRDLALGLIDVPAEIIVSDITLDSRTASPGSLFLACRGRRQHGMQFAREAVARGAKAVLFEAGAQEAGAQEAGAQEGGAGSGRMAPERRLAAELSSDLFVAEVPHLSRHVGVIADRFFDSPSQSLTIAGITGTNGKTTCAWVLAQALQQVRPAAYMGTLGFGIPPALTATEHTTADAVSVQRQLATLRHMGAECVCMEVSSHAIDQDRIAAVRFHTAAFTNLTRDHLDYHGTMEAYGAAKARLFEWPALAIRVINVDDPFGLQLASRSSAARLVVTSRSAELPKIEGLSHAAGVRGVAHRRQDEFFAVAEYVRATHVSANPAGLSIAVESSWGQAQLDVPLIGEFNVDNTLTVLAVLLTWNVPLARAAAALGQCSAPSGRMERFGGGSLPTAIVDYAHTPDALAKALRAARMHCDGRLRVVFGCGGDRDAGKRPLMGRVAVEMADDVIVTDDNPRTEDPARIVADVLAGMDQTSVVRVEHDRARAIQSALRDLRGGDVVLIAGKGHEDYQIYGTTRRVFRDQDVVRAELGVAMAHPGVTPAEGGRDQK